MRCKDIQNIIINKLFLNIFISLTYKKALLISEGLTNIFTLHLFYSLSTCI